MRSAAVAIAVLGFCLSANAQNLILLDDEALVTVSEKLEAELIVAVVGVDTSREFPRRGIFVLTEDAVHFLYESRRRKPIVLPYESVLARSMVIAAPGSRVPWIVIATDDNSYLFMLPEESLGRIMAELRVRMAQ